MCGKKFHNTGFLQKALGKQVYDVVSFIHIISGNVGSLDEDLNSGNISLSGVGLGVAVTCWTEISALRVGSSP